MKYVVNNREMAFANESNERERLTFTRWTADGAYFTTWQSGRLVEGHVCHCEGSYRVFIDGQLVTVEPTASEEAISQSGVLLSSTPRQNSSGTKRPAPRHGRTTADGYGLLTAPYACRLIAVSVEVGDLLTEGQPLYRIESMKMEHEVTCHVPAIVEAIHAQPGSSLARGDSILVLAAPPETERQ